MNIENWKYKSLEDLELHELAYAHLSPQGFFKLKDGCLTSILPITLREINHARRMDYSKNFIPIVGAFGIIEQIGFAYKRSDIPAYSNKDASSINKALYYFAGFGDNDDQTKALYALRNSFLHNASLLAKALHKNKPSYFFQFDREMDSLLEFPSSPWDGDIKTLNQKVTTKVNPEKVIDLATTIAENALISLKNSTLDVVLESGEIELYYRYLKHFKD